MKLKGAAKNMSPKTPVILGSVLGGALVLLRVYQTLSLIDPDTGFFRANAGVTVPLFYILAVGLALLTPAACYLCPLSKAEYIAAEKRPLHAVACLLFAVAVLGDSISLFTSGAVNDVSQSSVRHILSQNNGRLVNATAVLGVIAAVALALCSVSFFAGKELTKKAKVLYLAPALWALCKTMSYFTINASYLNNTSLLVCIFADVFLMVFFFEYARKVTGIAGDGNGVRVPAALRRGHRLSGRAAGTRGNTARAVRLLPAGRRAVLPYGRGAAAEKHRAGLRARGRDG